MPATSCATPNARCWSCASRSASGARQQVRRQDVRTIAAGAVAAKIIARLPEKEQQKRADKRGAAPGMRLQPEHASVRQAPERSRRKPQGPANNATRSEPCSIARLDAGLRQPAMQFHDERRIGTIETLLLDHAFPGGRADFELGCAFGPDLGEKALRLHGGRAKRKPHPLDRAQCRCARSCSLPAIRACRSAARIPRVRRARTAGTE